jgi:hypothetical protein
MPKPKLGDIHPTLFALFRPANRTSPARSIQFSFFLSAWFLFEYSASPQRNPLLSQPSHTVKDRVTRGQKSRSDYQITALLLSPVKSRSTEESLTCRALHRGGARLPIFKKTSMIFLSFFEVFLQSSKKPM